MTMIITATGQQIEVRHKRGDPLPDQVPGEHLWVMTGLWRVNPEAALAGSVLLDAENLLSIDGPGCLWCEEQWSPELAARPCPGEPR